MFLPCLHTLLRVSPSSQTSVRVCVHKHFEIHQVQQLLPREGHDALEYYHIGTIHCFLIEKERKEEVKVHEVLFVEKERNSGRGKSA